MNKYQHLSLIDTPLSSNGLNLHAVFNINELPLDTQTNLQDIDINLRNYRQLILIGHGGRDLWHAVSQSRVQSDNPIDDFTIKTIENFFTDQLSDHSYEIIYPGTHPIGLQTLGKLAGWHHDSPFRVGINSEWGTWFAYRAVILADTDFETSTPVQSSSPCDSCQAKPCISNCAGIALENKSLSFQKCIDYRKLPSSKCRYTCLSRISCPIAAEHRYSEEQIKYHYSISMKTIEQNY